MLVEKVQKDPYILAAIVAGSFSYAQVWEKSDLDVELIGRDAIRPTQSFFSLVENVELIGKYPREYKST